jgi:hypothetical protein
MKTLRLFLQIEKTKNFFLNGNFQKYSHSDLEGQILDSLYPIRLSGFQISMAVRGEERERFPSRIKKEDVEEDSIGRIAHFLVIVNGQIESAQAILCSNKSNSITFLI